MPAGVLRHRVVWGATCTENSLLGTEDVEERNDLRKQGPIAAGQCSEIPAQGQVFFSQPAHSIRSGSRLGVFCFERSKVVQRPLPRDTAGYSTGGRAGSWNKSGCTKCGY